MSNMPFYVAPSGYPVGGFMAFWVSGTRHPVRDPKTPYGDLPKRFPTMSGAEAYALKAIKRGATP